MSREKLVFGLSDRLTAALRLSGKSVLQLSKETKISRTSVYYHLNGQQAMSALAIARYASALNVSADYLLGLKGE